MSEWKEIELKQWTNKIGSGATPRGGSNSLKTHFKPSLLKSYGIPCRQN